MIEGFFRMRTPPGAYPPGYMPPGPGYPPQAPGYSPQAPYAPPQQQWAPPGGPVPNPPGPQLVPGPRHPLATLDPSQFTPELSQLLSSIAVPLQIHLSEEVDGTEFANWFMGGYGEATHQEIAALGPDVVVGALYSHPATLQSVQSFTPEKVRVFVEEFLNPQFDEQTPQVEETPAPTGPIPA